MCPDNPSGHLFVGGRRNHYNALIEILLLVTTIAVGEFCHQQFGLKNVRATYQRLMTKIFKPLIGHTIEVYIDDIVVKGKTRGENDQHLEEVFHLLRKYGMKLNLSKCAFGVTASKFLGFMVTQRGIEVNPDQIKVVMKTSTPSIKKELQRLTDRLVALGHFIA